MKYFLKRGIDDARYMIPENLKETWERLHKKEDRGEYDGWIEIENYKVE